MADPVADRVTLLLEAASRGESSAAEELLPLVYEELHRLARQRLALEPPGGTLQATALVHEAWLRLVGSGHAEDEGWNGRGHFFGAAARAMRRILVERARRRAGLRHGGALRRVELTESVAVGDEESLDLLALDAALARLEALDARKAEVVALRFFAGLSVDEAARALGVSPGTVKNDWAFARAWLHRELERG
jgi:RNA polymerase sigma factor (TIGR02999 family)